MKITKGIATLILCLCLVILVSFPVVASSASGKEAQSHSAEIITSLRADDIRWRYEEFGGHIYKRLYNYTRGEWVGDWIKC